MSTPDAEWQEGREVTPDPRNPAHVRLSAPITGARMVKTDGQRAAAAKPVAFHEGGTAETLTGSSKTLHAGLQKAFAHAEPFAQPVQLERGFSLHGADLAKRLAVWQQSLDTGRPFVQSGYTSTGFGFHMSGNVQWRIKAIKGIDVCPISSHSENEIILNHESAFKVTKIEHKGGKVYVHLEQVK